MATRCRRALDHRTGRSPAPAGRRGGRALLVVALAMLGLSLGLHTAPAAAQSGGDPGSLPQAIVTTASPLTPEQRERLKAFVAAQVALLAGDDPDKASRARNELASINSRPGVSEIFVREFASAARPALEPILAGDDAQRAVNATIVASSLRTPESIELLLRHSDPEREKRLPVRLRAVGSLGDALLTSGMTPVQIDATIRRVLASAGRETDWVALHHAFRTLVRIATAPKLPDETVAGAIRSQGELLDGLLARMAKEPGPSPLMNAVAQNLNLVVREELPTIRADRARLLRARLSALLTKLLAVVDSHWDAVRAAPGDAARPYASAVSVAELLLKVAATSDAQQELEVAFAKHWAANDRAAFAADLKKAEAVAAKLAAGAKDGAKQGG